MNEQRLERLQKIIARAGVASRRKAEELIRQGRVTVNGRQVTELGVKADPHRDHIKVDGRLLQPEPLVYFAVHKPAGVLSAVSDPEGRRVVTELVPCRFRLYPAGRLDYESEGLMVLTNDGGMARGLTRAGTLPKVYQVKVAGRPAEARLDLLRRGLSLSEHETFAPCTIRCLKDAPNMWFEVVLREGRNRQIRRMFEAIGCWVMRLRRVAIGPLTLAGLKPGQWRELTEREVHQLRQAMTGRGGADPAEPAAHPGRRRKAHRPARPVHLPRSGSRRQR